MMFPCQNWPPAANIEDGTEPSGYSDHDSRTYLAWANSYGRMLARLGLKGSEAQTPLTIHELLARRAAR